MIENTISINEAVTEADNINTPETVRRWVKKYPGLGYRFGPRQYRIYRSAWRKVCAGVHPADLAA